MAHRNYLIRYANGFKRHASQAEIDLLGSDAAKVGPREYFCDSYATDRKRTEGPHFLPGTFKVEYPERLGGKTIRERMESTIGMVTRLRAQKALA